MATDTPPLLEYSVSTTPDPLQVSPGQAVLTLVISNPGGSDNPVYVQKILIGFPVGGQSFALTEDSSAIVPQTGTSTDWQLTQTSPGNFQAAPPNEGSIEVGDEGVVLQLTQIPINAEVGTVTLSIAEFSAPTEEGPFSRKNTSSQVSKFPYGFFMRNFVPTVPDVPDGGSVTLTWQGSDQARYFIQYDQSVPKVDVSEQRSWDSPALHNDTTFLLEAVVTADNNESVSTFLSTTVTVDNPELSATSLVVQGTSTLQGAATVGVQGGPSANLLVNGDAKVTGTLEVDGTANLLATAILQGLTVNGAMTLNGSLGMLKWHDIFGNNQTLTADTDGLAIAGMVPQGSSGSKSAGWVTIQTPKAKYRAFGGNLAGPGGQFYAVPGILCVPIQKGWSVTWAWEFATSDTAPLAFFNWVSFSAA